MSSILRFGCIFQDIIAHGVGRHWMVSKFLYMVYNRPLHFVSNRKHLSISQWSAIISIFLRRCIRLCRLSEYGKMVVFSLAARWHSLLPLRLVPQIIFSWQECSNKRCNNFERHRIRSSCTSNTLENNFIAVTIGNDCRTSLPASYSYSQFYNLGLIMFGVSGREGEKGIGNPQQDQGCSDPQTRIPMCHWADVVSAYLMTNIE